MVQWQQVRITRGLMGAEHDSRLFRSRAARQINANEHLARGSRPPNCHLRKIYYFDNLVQGELNNVFIFKFY